MKLDCIIIEDEPLAQERIRGYLGKLPFMELLAVFDSGMDAVAFLQQRRPEVIFLDIQLGDLSGIQLLESMRLESQVIISTAHHEYALKGYELKVADYLLKPYTFDRFLQAINRVQELRVRSVSPPEKRAVYIKTEYRLERVLPGELLYIEGMRDYRRIHTVSKQIMTLQTFGELEALFPAGIACRVHKSFLVALDKIDAIERDIVRVGGKEIPVSETYRAALMRMLMG